MSFLDNLVSLFLGAEMNLEKKAQRNINSKYAAKTPSEREEAHEFSFSFDLSKN